MYSFSRAPGRSAIRPYAGAAAAAATAAATAGSGPGPSDPRLLGLAAGSNGPADSPASQAASDRAAAAGSSGLVFGPGQPGLGPGPGPGPAPNLDRVSDRVATGAGPVEIQVGGDYQLEVGGLEHKTLNPKP